MIGQTLQEIRKLKGLSQSELASRAETFQANISEIENGLSNPNLQTAEAIFSQLEYRLLPVPYQGLTVQEWGTEINAALAIDNEKRAFRLFLQLNDDLEFLPPEFVILAALTPPTISNSKYYLLISALVELHLEKSRLPLPTWIASDSSKLKTPWFVDEYSNNKEEIRSSTPIFFSKRNIFVSESELKSV